MKFTSQKHGNKEIALKNVNVFSVRMDLGNRQFSTRSRVTLHTSFLGRKPFTSKAAGRLHCKTPSASIGEIFSNTRTIITLSRLMKGSGRTGSVTVYTTH